MANIPEELKAALKKELAAAGFKNLVFVPAKIVSQAMKKETGDAKQR